ncbi:Abi family protein [Colibacter massiliensis]|uniref:Abi family protein n=1 Tax=Colibacter massiliensis TaxID=1852379 RepID=UPI003F9294B3
MYQYPKNFLSVTQLIQKLIDAGMTIDSQDEAKLALTTIGYYRLKGYSFHRIDPATKKYIAGTKFSDLLKLYHFDSELSHLIFSYLSQIEVALRARLVNAFQTTQDALILHDPSVFKDKQLYWRNQGTIASEISRSNDVFIEHNFNNHEGAIPLWASVEVMSFGTISKTIKNMKTGNQSAFSVLIQNYKFKNANGNMVNPSKDMFASWIQAVSVMRNICAHNSRIYNRAINTRPQLISSDLINPQPRYNGLYQIMLSMKYLRPTEESWTDFVNDFKQLLSKYAGAYDINRMNFPSDWESHF